MTGGSLSLGFGGRQVIVKTNDPEALAALERSFHEMLEAEEKKAAGRFQVQRSGKTWRVSGENGFEPRELSLLHALRYVRYGIIQCLIQECPELLWLHAGAAVRGDGAVVVSGHSGCGKSTLITSLCARGWTYLSDEVVPLDPRSGTVLPFPLTPAFRKDSGRVLPLRRLQALPKTEVRLDTGTVSREPVMVGALVFPTYSRHAPTNLSPCPPAAAALELLQSCQNFERHREAALDYFCNLVESRPVYRLSFSSGPLAAALISEAHQA